MTTETEGPVSRAVIATSTALRPAARTHVSFPLSVSKRFRPQSFAATVAGWAGLATEIARRHRAGR